MYAFCLNSAVNRIDPYGNKVEMTIERRLNESYIPKGANGSGRARVIINPSNIKVYCKNCRLVPIFLYGNDLSLIIKVIEFFPLYRPIGNAGVRRNVQNQRFKFIKLYLGVFIKEFLLE